MYHNYNIESRVKGLVDSVITTTCFLNKYNGLISTTNIYKRVALYDKKRRIAIAYDFSYTDLPNGESIDKLKPTKTNYVYNINGDLIQIMTYFPAGGPWSKSIFLTQKNTVIDKDYYCPRNDLTNWDTSKFDVYGKVIETDAYGGKGVGLFSKSYFKYDLNGKQIEEDCYRNNGSLMFIRYCKYDGDGNLIEDQHPNGERDVYKYTYEEYDKMHNWTIQTKYINDKPFEVIERHIAYTN